jgi:hypothetical protein
MNLSDHFTYEEAIATQHREYIEMNKPSDAIHTTMVMIAIRMEKVRALLGKPIHINSWYRCPQLNAAIGGAKNSDHMTGSAVDFICPDFGNPLDICKHIIDNHQLIRFKQLILEHTWVHISWDTIPGVPPKLQVLSLLKSGGYGNGLCNTDGVAYT